MTAPHWDVNAFLDLPIELADAKQSRFHILPIPFDATTSYCSGAAAGPDAIIAASQQVELFDEHLLSEFHQAGIHTLAPLSCRGSLEAIHGEIYEAARDSVQKGKFLLGLGGEHAVSGPLIRAYKEQYPNLSVLQIDAHADLRDTYHDTPLSHACVMRRVFDMGVPFIGVGIRSFCGEQYRFRQKHNISWLTPATVREHPLNAVATVLESLSDQVYITFDIDGLDPAVAPGTGTPEPGGLFWEETMILLEAVGRKKQIVGADIVEVMPLPGNHVTEFTAARLACKLIAFSQLRAGCL